MLEGEIKSRLRVLIEEVCAEIKAEILALEIMPDHAHLLVEAQPQFGIHRAVKRIKGRTSRCLRDEFPKPRSRLSPRWTNSYFVSAVGGAPLAAIKKYVEEQIEKEDCGTFVLPIPLRYSEGRGEFLDRQFAAANWLHDKLVETEKAELELLEATDAWKLNQQVFGILYRLADAAPEDKEIRRGLKEEGKRRTVMLREHGLDKFAFMQKIQTWRVAEEKTKRLIGTHIAQSVWHMFEKYLYAVGKGVSSGPKRNAGRLKAKTTIRCFR